MSLSKINYAGHVLQVFTVVDNKGEKWYQANPFAEALGYTRHNKAIFQNVSSENQKKLWQYQVGKGS